MDFLIELGNLILIWTLVLIALVFLVGAALTQRSIVKTQRAKITRPSLTSGSLVVFEEVGSRKPQSFVVTSIRFDGKRRDVTLQDQVSWGLDRRHDDLP